jgi:hypothetical protein
MATLPTSSYSPLVPYEPSTCSWCASGLKLVMFVGVIVTVACAIFAASVYTRSIPFSGMEWVPRLAIAGAIIAPLLSIGLVCLWKGAYNEIYPQGTWKDFLKRDWNDFLGHNHKQLLGFKICLSMWSSQSSFL